MALLKKIRRVDLLVMPSDSCDYYTPAVMTLSACTVKFNSMCKLHSSDASAPGCEAATLHSAANGHIHRADVIVDILRAFCICPKRVRCAALTLSTEHRRRYGSMLQS
jgi:hypothetical protein